MTNALDRTDFNDEAVRECRRVQGLPLIDKIEIKNIGVEIVDEELCSQNTNIITKADGNKKFVISDKVVPKFIADVTNGIQDTPYIHLQAGVLGKYGNLICDNIDGLHERLQTIQEWLLGEYGLKVDYTDAVIHYVEINKTMFLHDDFADYKRVFLLLMSLIPRAERLDKEILCGNAVPVNEVYSEMEIESIYRQSKDHTIGVVFYDKTRQLQEQGVDIPAPFARFEVKLRGRKVYQKLGTAFLSELTDETLDNVMRTIVNDYFIEPWYKWQDMRIAEIADIFRQEYAEGGDYVLKTMYRIASLDRDTTPYVLDSRQIISGLSCADIYPKTHYGNVKKDRDKKRIASLCENVFPQYRQGLSANLSFITSKMFDTYLTNV